MSVVVVVTGAGTVVCCVVVVEVREPLSVPQPVTDTNATAATQAMMSFGISIFLFVLFVYLSAGPYAIIWSRAMGCNPTGYSSYITVPIISARP